MSPAIASSFGVVVYLALFALTGIAFLFVNLLVGMLLRPHDPHAEKLEIYECGEPTIGSSFVQFDLRFYVVALLFIIFDVEVAFFFPWAAVFGKATQLSAEPSAAHASTSVATRLQELGVDDASAAKSMQSGELQQSARDLALTSFADIGAFFGVLLVGFAYVWKRGDLDWVRVVARDRVQPLHRPPPPRVLEPSQSILSA